MFSRVTATSMLSLLLVLAANGLSGADGSPSVPNVKRIVFLGDSITYSGEYVATVEAALLLQKPERDYEIVDLGLPSETVSGLSEPGHAGGSFPRPNLHERLDRVQVCRVRQFPACRNRVMRAGASRGRTCTNVWTGC